MRRPPRSAVAAAIVPLLVGCQQVAESGLLLTPPAPADAGAPPPPIDAGRPDAGPPPPVDAGAPARDLEDGEPCATDRQCAGGTCFTPPGWPGGHCTTLDCEARGDTCASHRGADNACVPGFGPAADAESWCARGCDTTRDCRDGYVCLPADRFEAAAGLCIPDRAEAPVFAPSVYDSFDIRCGLAAVDGAITIPYALLPSHAYMVTAFSRDGRYVLPRTITGPAGVIDFAGDNAHQTLTTTLHGWLAPIVVPTTPRLLGQRADGPHGFTLETRSQDLCLQVLAEPTPGARLDLNVYFVGLFRLEASNARDDADLQAVLQVVDRRLAPAGVRLGAVRYYDADLRTAEQHRIVRSSEGFRDLMATARDPGPGRDNLLSLNLFFVVGFMYDDGGGPLGIAAGLPGPAGLHGTRASGVASTSQLLGQSTRAQDGRVIDGNDLTGTIIAHEIGHYLGLFHTTEVDADDHDPLADTPECAPDRFPRGCPDLGNLMFPYADPDNTALTPGQAFVLQAHPLTKD